MIHIVFASVEGFSVNPHYASTLQTVWATVLFSSLSCQQFCKEKNSFPKMQSQHINIAQSTSVLGNMNSSSPYSCVCSIQPVAHLSDIICTQEPPRLVVVRRSSRLHVTNPSSWIGHVSVMIHWRHVCSCHQCVDVFFFFHSEVQVSNQLVLLPRGGNYGMVVVAVCLELLLHGAWRLHVVAIFCMLLHIFQT